MVYTDMDAISFEWDPGKNEDNLRKHKIRFEDAIQIFESFVVETEDWRESQQGETRIRVLGGRNGLVLFVVYTWRGNKQRIITARLATPPERKAYYAKKYEKD